MAIMKTKHRVVSFIHRLIWCDGLLCLLWVFNASLDCPCPLSLGRL